MSTNSLTLQHVMDRRGTTGLTYVARYRTMIVAQARAALSGDDEAYRKAGEQARKIAHYAADSGNADLLIDQLERQL